MIWFWCILIGIPLLFTFPVANMHVEHMFRNHRDLMLRDGWTRPTYYLMCLLWPVTVPFFFTPRSLWKEHKKDKEEALTLRLQDLQNELKRLQAEEGKETDRLEAEFAKLQEKEQRQEVQA